MAITALPPAPSRGDPSTFAAKGDALLGGLSGTFVPEMNTEIANINTKSAIAVAAADSATTLAASAAASAAAAASSAGAALWVTGTTYALGVVVYSPLTKSVFRKITASSVSSTDPANDGTNWAAVFVPQGMRNRIINGSCDIAQRGSNQFSSTNVTGYAGPDRFYAVNSNAGGQFTQSQSSLTFGSVAKATVRQTVNTAVSDLSTSKFWGGISQLIEGYNAYDLLGKQISVSFIFNSNITGNFSVAVRDAASGYSYVTVFAAVANTPIKVTLSLAAIPTAASIPRTSGLGLQVSIGALNNATYLTSTLNAWQAANYISAGTLTNWGLTAGNFIEVTDLQLEEGGACTAFERRSFAGEVLLCQRYYQQLGSLRIGGYNLTASELAAPVIFNDMRAIPTITTLTAFSLSNSSAPTYTNSTTNCFGLRTLVTATGASTATDGLISLSAEL